MGNRYTQCPTISRGERGFGPISCGNQTKTKDCSGSKGKNVLCKKWIVDKFRISVKKEEYQTNIWMKLEEHTESNNIKTRMEATKNYYKICSTRSH